MKICNIIEEIKKDQCVWSKASNKEKVEMWLGNVGHITQGLVCCVKYFGLYPKTIGKHCLI